MSRFEKYLITELTPRLSKGFMISKKGHGLFAGKKTRTCETCGKEYRPFHWDKNEKTHKCQACKNKEEK
jgi:hypothetical protein